MQNELQKHLPIVKPLFDQITSIPKQAILNGELVINVNPTQEETKEYYKPLQESRLAKLKLTLTKQRLKMYKKDYIDRSNDIDALERGINHPGWME